MYTTHALWSFANQILIRLHVQTSTCISFLVRLLQCMPLSWLMSFFTINFPLFIPFTFSPWSLSLSFLVRINIYISCCLHLFANISLSYVCQFNYCSYIWLFFYLCFTLSVPLFYLFISSLFIHTHSRKCQLRPRQPGAAVSRAGLLAPPLSLSLPPSPPLSSLGARAA